MEKYGKAGNQEMNNQLTEKDIKKMEEEIEYRKLVVRKEAIEAVKEARAQGDLSENFEYHAARREVNRNNSRIRYLEQMIKTAKVITDTSTAETVGLFDRVTVFMENLQQEKVFVLTTTLRQDALNGYLSKESPLGAALMGRQVGDRISVRVNEKFSYFVRIRSIEKGEDDESLAISSY